MPDNALLDQLLNSFPKQNKQDWSRAASKEISEKNPWENLIWKSDDEINFLPYYDADDLASLQYLNHFTRISNESALDARSWISLPKISISTNKNANAVALNHLANGADGVLFDLGTDPNIDLDILLSEINWPYCNVSFLETHLPNLIQHITQLSSKKKYDPDLLTGTIFCKSPRDIYSHDLKGLIGFKQLRTFGVIIPASSPVKEISSALIHATQLMDKLTDAGHSKEFVWRNIGFSIASGKNFLLDIAKQKTLRLLLYQIGRAFELADSSEIEINIRVEPFVDDRFQPQGNMISESVAALAAVIGGCDSLTIIPEDETNETMTRIARNVSNILREESHLNKVADPVSGAYAVESIVDQLAVAAWREFQQNVNTK